uniref:Uncharacterized protein n=1 Tax=Trichogramma kaykai TaxID=54128 RepID=A0ABD2WK44_9HYME
MQRERSIHPSIQAIHADTRAVIALCIPNHSYLTPVPIAWAPRTTRYTAEILPTLHTHTRIRIIRVIAFATSTHASNSLIDADSWRESNRSVSSSIKPDISTIYTPKKTNEYWVCTIYKRPPPERSI